jgi:hypothetical protein
LKAVVVREQQPQAGETLDLASHPWAQCQH